MPVILDYGISIEWSFVYWISMALFLLAQVCFAATQNWCQWTSETARVRT